MKRYTSHTHYRLAWRKQGFYQAELRLILSLVLLVGAAVASLFISGKVGL